MTPRSFPRLLVACSLVVAACGDDGSGSPDARDTPDSEARSDGPLPNECDHDEADDPGNDAAPEASGLTLAATGEISICGTVAAEPPDQGTIDRDIFSFEVPADAAGPVLVRIVAPGGDEIGALEGLLADGQGNVVGAGTLAGNHAVLVGEVDENTWNVVVVASGDAAPSAPIAYQIRIKTDDPGARCVTPATVAYTESADGATSVDNDMVNVSYGTGGGTRQTTNPDDAPETSADEVTVSPAMSYAIAGTAGVNANIETPDEYLDKDTYLIATGANTNQIDIRVAWPDGIGADLDFYLFEVPAGTDDPRSVASGSFATNAGPELVTTAVLPSTTYWLWVGQYDQVGAPATMDYAVTICGAQFMR